MSAGIYDILTEGNSDFDLYIEYVDYNNNLISLSAKTITFSIKRSYLYDRNDLFSFNNNNNQVEGDLEYPNTNNTFGHITVNSNQIYLTINKETISSLEPGKYFYSIKITGTTTETLLRGKFEIEGF